MAVSRDESEGRYGRRGRCKCDGREYDGVEVEGWLHAEDGDVEDACYDGTGTALFVEDAGRDSLLRVRGGPGQPYSYRRWTGTVVFVKEMGRDGIRQL